MSATGSALPYDMSSMVLAGLALLTLIFVRIMRETAGTARDTAPAGR